MAPRTVVNPLAEADPEQKRRSFLGSAGPINKVSALRGAYHVPVLSLPITYPFTLYLSRTRSHSTYHSPVHTLPITYPFTLYPSPTRSHTTYH